MSSPIAKSFLGPVRNVIVRSRLAIRPWRGEIVGTRIVPARTDVDVVVSPGILRHGIGIHIWSLPVLSVVRLLDEIRESALSLGVISVVDLKRVQRSFESGDLGHCGLPARVF